MKKLSFFKLNLYIIRVEVGIKEEKLVLISFLFKIILGGTKLVKEIKFKRGQTQLIFIYLQFLK